MRQLPNLLCFVRLAMAPVCAWLVIGGRWSEALWISGIAGVTDFWDGWLARHFDWKSELGEVLDPLADKVLLVAVYLALGWSHAIPWMLVWLVFGRDMLIVMGAIFIRRRTAIDRFPPTMLGKISTTIQIAAGLAIMAARAGLMSPHAVPIAVWSVAAGTTASGLDYLARGWSMMRRKASP